MSFFHPKFASSYSMFATIGSILIVNGLVRMYFHRPYDVWALVLGVLLLIPVREVHRH